MRARRHLVPAAAAILAAGAALAEITEYTEDFRTRQWADVARTTALWDTVAGELRLPPLPLADRGTLDTPGTAYAVIALGTVLVEADGAGGLRVIAPDDPDQPVQVGGVLLADQVRGLAAAGAWVWAAVGSAGLQPVDLHDPAAPLPQPAVDGPGFAQDVAVGDGRLYVAQGSGGIGVYDLPDPAAPQHVADVPGADWIRGLDVAGAVLLAADGAAGVVRYALDQGPLPVATDTLDTPGVCQDVALAGGLAYAADGAAGLQVLVLAADGTLVRLAGLPLPGTAAGVTVAGDTVLVACGDGGLHLVDVADPSAPVLRGTAPSANWSWRALARDDTVWLADGSAGLRAFTVDPYGLDQTADVARSLDLNLEIDPVVRARLTADATDSVLFDLSDDGGLSWTAVAADGSWLDFDAPAADVRWRARLRLVGGWPGPVCRSLVIGLDRDPSHAVITEVADVPGDDGGQVRVRWQASRHDTAGAAYVVTEYSVYRRIDAAKRWPAGAWEYLLSVPADREREYAAVVPTLADATPDRAAWTVLFVRARTTVPGVVFDSKPDSGQSVADLLPPAPTGLSIDRQVGGATVLAWHPSTDPDFAHFRVYRSDRPDAPPGPATLAYVTTGTGWTDTAPGYWYYLLTAVDLTGRESLPAGSLSGVPAAADGPALTGAVPNPVNPATSVAFTVPPAGARVRLAVHDARGRLVAVLADDWLPGGPHRRTWDGRDRRGRPAASGVYTVRLTGGGTADALKLTIVR